MNQVGLRNHAICLNSEKNYHVTVVYLEQVTDDEYAYVLGWARHHFGGKSYLSQIGYSTQKFGAQSVKIQGVLANDIQSFRHGLEHKAIKFPGIWKKVSQRNLTVHCDTKGAFLSDLGTFAMK